MNLNTEINIAVLIVMTGGATVPQSPTRQLYVASHWPNSVLISGVISLITTQSAWPRNSSYFGENLLEDAGGRVLSWRTSKALKAK